MPLLPSHHASSRAPSLLRYVGLERARPRSERVVDVLAFVTLGLVVGVGVGLLVARKPGAQLRAEIRDVLGGRGPLSPAGLGG